LGDAVNWQPIETAPREGVCLFWIRARKFSEQWRFERSDAPILMDSVLPRIFVGKNKTWSSLMIGTHWMPLPPDPNPIDAEQKLDKKTDSLHMDECGLRNGGIRCTCLPSDGEPTDKPGAKS
jgi:hypothetical protein